MVKWFEHSEEVSADARAKSHRDREYYDNVQWTAAEVQELDKRGQAATVFNHVRRKVNFLLGYETQTRADPKAFPRNPQDEQSSEAATDSLRFVQDSVGLPEKHSDVFENMVVEGFGALEVLYDVEKDKHDIKYWPWDRLFYDPYSARPDFSDGLYKGTVTWMDEERAVQKYGNKEAITETINHAERETANTKTYEDKPRYNLWAKLGARKRIRVVQIYWKNGREWWWAHYTRGGILDGNKPVIFKDEDGDTECPLIMQSAYVDGENCRYGEVRELVSPQDAINKGYSKWLHSLSTRQVIAEAGAVDDVNKAREELARPDGWVTKNPGKDLDVDRGEDFAVGSANILLNAKQEMEAAGPNAALQGKQGDQASGRAIIASQQGGIAELGQLMRRYRHFRLNVYRQIWNRVRQFWTAEKWVRVTDDERNVRFVGLNQPIKLIDSVVEQEGLEEPPKTPQEGAALMVKAGLSQADPESVVGVRNEVAKMDMDIILDEAPDTVTIQQEQFTEIAKLAGVRGDIPTELLIELSQLRNKDKILEKLKGGGEMTPEQKQAAAEQQAMAKQAAMIELAGGAADVKKTEAEALDKMANAEQTKLETAVAIGALAQ
ncbi:MAG: hypothetical protein GY952_06735 [Rhodobacteraceae bacterium]|nr:hypothetical protein [Paracoccaceae bacterium]